MAKKLPIHDGGSVPFPVCAVSGHSRAVTSVAFSPDGKKPASASDDKTIKLWDLAGGKEINTLSGHSLIVWSVAFSPDGKKLASAFTVDRHLDGRDLNHCVPAHTRESQN